MRGLPTDALLFISLQEIRLAHCTLPEPGVEHHLAVALPDYQYAWIYERWHTRQAISDGSLGICILNRELFRDMFGTDLSLIHI